MTLLDYKSFEPLVNTTFKAKLHEPLPELEGMDLGPTELVLELVEVKETSNDQCDSFSLIFHGPADRRLPQKLYSLHSDTLGECRIFLVPVGEKAEGEGDSRKTVGYQYQAIFNRLKEEK